MGENGIAKDGPDLQGGNLGNDFALEPGQQHGFLLQLLDKRIHGSQADTLSHRGPMAAIWCRGGPRRGRIRGGFLFGGHEEN